MEISQPLIDRFFQNRCSPEEVDAVVRYLLENQEALERFAGKREWDEIMAGVYDAPASSEKVLVQLKQHLFGKPEMKVFSLDNTHVSRLIAAASIIIIALGSWWFAHSTNAPGKHIVATAKAAIQSTGIEALNTWQLKTNSSKQPLKINLQDGSVITLFQNSTVKYEQPFSGNERRVFLNGDALFEVAKNKRKPFIVYSGKLSTTALGTSFRVTAFGEGKDSIHIKLFTGKIVIKPVKNDNKWKRDVYLLPGDQLAYCAPNMGLSVSRLARVNNTLNSNDANSKEAQKNELKFSNTSLTEVLKALSLLHNISISYQAADIEKKNFTGTVNKSDDLQAILRVIAQMNDLEVKASEEGFSIRKAGKQ